MGQSLLKTAVSCSQIYFNHIVEKNKQVIDVLWLQAENIETQELYKTWRKKMSDKDSELALTALYSDQLISVSHYQTK